MSGPTKLHRSGMNASAVGEAVVEVWVVMRTWSNQPLQMTAGCAFMFVLVQLPGAADLGC
jgi:hypothetical protein